MAVMHGRREQVIPGNALAVDAEMPFQSLTKFGTAFLNKLQCSRVPSPILDRISFIDTPGVLSGEKQRIGRAYNFPAVIEWFAERADRILLLFDAHKLDVSDEFKRVIEALRGHDDKIRVVLNKADTISDQQLMRVYGALMWSLGRVFKSPEVPRVYIGSFWDKPFQRDDSRKLFEAEQNDLIADLCSLPRNSAIRKVNELVKRARLAKVHAYIINDLRNEMPSLWGKAKKQEKILNNLPQFFQKIAQKHRLPLGDFPHVGRFRNMLKNYELNKFPGLNEKMVRKMEEVLSTDIPALMREMQHPQARRSDSDADLQAQVMGTAGANPFGASEHVETASWLITAAKKAAYDNEFYSYRPAQGKLTAARAKEVLFKSGLPRDSLFKVWKLSDIDKDGCLDAEEFAVAKHIIDCTLHAGMEIPDSLPPGLMPPSKRLQYSEHML